MFFYLLLLRAIDDRITYIKDIFKLSIFFKFTNKYKMFYSSVDDDKVNGVNDDDDDGMRAIMEKVEKGFKNVDAVFGGRVH